MASALEKLKAAQSAKKAQKAEMVSTAAGLRPVVPMELRNEPEVQALAQAEEELPSELPEIVDMNDTKIALEKRVWQAFNTPKGSPGGIPIVGYSTVEAASVFPHDNMNSVRRVIWKLRKDNMLVDSDIRRKAQKGGVPLTVWIPVKAG